ncbi:MAG: Lrp/AsnC family transcriptional regulator [Candidatus Micrarchaeota archaeon]
MKLDEIDEKILSILKSNSRTSNVQIAKQVKLTEGAVRNRIEHLVKNGAIKSFTIEIGTGSSFFAIVMLKAKHETKKMMAEISESKIAKDSYEISGDFDGCAIIEGNALEEIDSKIDELRKLKNVNDTKTFISLKRW